MEVAEIVEQIQRLAEQQYRLIQNVRRFADDLRAAGRYAEASYLEISLQMLNTDDQVVH
jgi:hypothetical protein